MRRSLLAMTLMTGFVAAVALSAPACGSSSPAGTDGGGGTAGKGGGGTAGKGGGGTAGKGGSAGTGGSAGSGGTAGSPGDSGTCSMPVDAGGAGLLPVACVSCLATACDDALNACLCDPQCVDVIKCLDACVEKGGTAMTCAINCADMAPTDGGAGAEALTVLSCAEGKCSGDGAPGTNPCSAPPAGDAGDAGDAAK